MAISMKEPKALGESCYLPAFTCQNRLFYRPKQTVLVSRTDCFNQQTHWLNTTASTGSFPSL